MHKRFPKCGDCHNTAHDLNNWPAKQDKAQPGAKPQPAAKPQAGAKK